METKLILCDLDGTLLRSDKTISDKTAEVLESCRRRGILIGFSTSRGRANIVPFEEKIKPDILICNGGASVVCHDELILTQLFSLEETHALLTPLTESAEVMLKSLLIPWIKFSGIGRKIRAQTTPAGPFMTILRTLVNRQ